MVFFFFFHLRLWCSLWEFRNFTFNCSNRGYYYNFFIKKERKKQLIKIKIKELGSNFIKLLKGYLLFCQNEKVINKTKIK